MLNPELSMNHGQVESQKRLKSRTGTEFQKGRIAKEKCNGICINIIHFRRPSRIKGHSIYVSASNKGRCEIKLINKNQTNQ